MLSSNCIIFFFVYSFLGRLFDRPVNRLDSVVQDVLRMGSLGLSESMSFVFMVFDYECILNDSMQF